MLRAPEKVAYNFKTLTSNFLGKMFLNGHMAQFDPIGINEF